MDNYENYLYILFAVIYIISRIIKARSKQKKEQQPQSQGQTSGPSVPQNQQKPKKAFSFEDILKEFEKNLAGEEESAHEKPLPVKEIQYEQPAPVAVKQVKETPNPYDSYQGTPYRSIKEEIELDKEKESSFVRSENYSIKTSVASEYVKMLQDPQGFKNAIVMSEIINRKYF